MRRHYSYEDERTYYQAKHDPGAPVGDTEGVAARLKAFVGDAATVFKGKHVLEIGAGGCLYARYFADRLPVAQVVALDLFLFHLSRVHKACPTSRLKFVAGDCFALPFQDGSFELVFCNLLLCQLPDLDRVAHEVKRVLVPGGHFLSIEPNPFNPLHLFRYWFGRHSPNQYLLRRHHLRAFESLGFTVRQIFFYPGVPFHSRLMASSMGIHATQGLGT
jgi:ubiquinone/menaquinone biosynthesis C-methylase UbiE